MTDALPPINYAELILSIGVLLVQIIFAARLALIAFYGGKADGDKMGGFWGVLLAAQAASVSGVILEASQSSMSESLAFWFGASVGRMTIFTLVGCVPSWLLGRCLRPPPIPLSKMFYTSANEESAGPFSLEKIQCFVSEGRMDAETLICAEGAQNWRPFKEVMNHVETNIRTHLTPRELFGGTGKAVTAGYFACVLCFSIYDYWARHSWDEMISGNRDLVDLRNCYRNVLWPLRFLGVWEPEVKAVAEDQVEFRAQGFTYNVKNPVPDRVIVLKAYVVNKSETVIEGDVEIAVEPDLQWLSGAFMENYRINYRDQLAGSADDSRSLEIASIVNQHLSEWRDGMGVPEDSRLATEPNDEPLLLRLYHAIKLKPGEGRNIEVPVPMPQKYYKHVLKVRFVRFTPRPDKSAMVPVPVQGPMITFNEDMKWSEHALGGLGCWRRRCTGP